MIKSKEQQIEEMAKTIFLYVDSKGKKNVYIVGSEFADDLKTYSHNYGVAETLYNAGYRKTFTSDLANDTQKALKEFAEYLKEYARACKSSGYDGIGENDIDDLLKEYEQ